MTNWANCLIEFDFEFSKVNNNAMRLIVEYNAKKYDVIPNFVGDIGTARINLPITLPTYVTLIVSNKGINDTIVDDTNKIIQDCYIKVTSVKIDKFKLNDIFLHQKIHLVTHDNNVVTSNYFGFNGHAVLDFKKTTVLAQYLSLNQSNVI